MAKKKKTGLGRGLDSLIPALPEEDEAEEKSSLTLEDLLKEKEEEKKDKYNSKEKKDNKKSKSKTIDTKSSKTSKIAEKEDTEEPKSKIAEKEDTKELKSSSKKIAAEKTPISDSLEDEIATRTQAEPSQIAKEADKQLSETPKTAETNTIKAPVEPFQEVAIKDEIVEVVEVAEATEVELNTPNEVEKTVEDIRDNLTDREKQSIDEVIKIIEKNPRITLWSAKSAAVFRYLRKTEPEFSISKEASKLIDEAVQSKYPEIWTLFKDIEK